MHLDSEGHKFRGNAAEYALSPEKHPWGASLVRAQSTEAASWQQKMHLLMERQVKGRGTQVGRVQGGGVNQPPPPTQTQLGSGDSQGGKGPREGQHQED